MMVSYNTSTTNAAVTSISTNSNTIPTTNTSYYDPNDPNNNNNYYYDYSANPEQQQADAQNYYNYYNYNYGTSETTTGTDTTINGDTTAITTGGYYYPDPNSATEYSYYDPNTYYNTNVENTGYTTEDYTNNSNYVQPTTTTTSSAYPNSGSSIEANESIILQNPNLDIPIIPPVATVDDGTNNGNQEQFPMNLPPIFTAAT